MAVEVDSLSPVNDEAALIAGTRAGDTTCFEALMRRYERRIYRTDEVAQAQTRPNLT